MCCTLPCFLRLDIRIPIRLPVQLGESTFRVRAEIQAKPGRREIVTIAKFKDEMGVMTPSCWCKTHDLEGRTIYDMHELDPEQNEVSKVEFDIAKCQTAMQIYTSSYKALAPEASFATLRKAKRLEALLPESRVVEVEKRCVKCGVDVSPMWYGHLERVCHQCRMRR